MLYFSLSKASPVMIYNFEMKIYPPHPPGPPPVSQLHIRHADETSLSALWNHSFGSGSRDGYTVELYYTAGSTANKTRRLTRDMRECTFNVLVPGHMYTIVVTTTSGDLRSSATVTGRTCKAAFKQILCSWYQHLLRLMQIDHGRVIE